ncbi:MAG TPA: ABC transporter substrate-binding protein [Solirubrobacteraceae bacterium]|nr:ABC transporter substrate-binding protein [Solirubrobacteraceae bacterium]
MRCRAAIVLAAVVVLAAGCGGSSSADRAPHPLKQVQLMLDFTPNAVHAGIYAALARHYDSDEGIALHVRPPPSPVDSIKLLEQGRVDFAVLDIHDLAIARERGEPLVGVMAIVERPLASVIAQPSIKTPRELQGRTVGVTGDPSDYAVLDSIVAGAGGHPRSVHTITIGSDAVADLLAGRVAAATAFWNDEGVALALQRPGYHVFRVENFGAPAYPELVLCARRETVARDPALVRAVVKTLTRGYELAIARPAVASADLERQVPGLDPRLVRADLAALRSSFAPGGGDPGELHVATLRAWGVWEARFRLVTRRPDVAAMFDPRFAR